MGFGDFQRQVQIVTDPAEIEKWKEEARKVTTYSTAREESPQTFASATEAERHFEKNYLAGLVRTVSEIVVDGPGSRRMHDRVLNKVIENAWVHETKSPSPMMQELAARFREAGLHVFRHRRGMLFVSPVFPRPFTEKQTAVSSQVRMIVDAIAASPRIGRKELADKLILDSQKSVEAAVPVAEGIERAKLALASDLLWLISAGHVIEFNDGSLDLPRAKTKPKENAETAMPAAEAESRQEAAVEAGVPPTEKERAIAEMSSAEKEARVEAGAPPADETPEAQKEPEDVVAAAVSAAETGSTESRPTEETDVGGS
jgi:hypothetical protein